MSKISGIVPSSELQTYVEKGIDVHIAIDMIHLALNDCFDTAILVSGDSDFVPAIKLAKQQKKKVQVAAFVDGYNQCYDLKNACNSFITLNYMIPPILRHQKAKKP